LQVETEKSLSLRSRLKKWPRWCKWAMVIVIILIAGTGLFIKGKSTPLPVEVAIVNKQNLERSVFTNGRLNAVQEQNFFTPVNSTLMELKVKAGDRVHKGDVLGRLDTLELGRRYEEARANLASKEAELARAEAQSDHLDFKLAEAEYIKAKNNWDRVNTLHQAGAVTMTELETSQVDLAKAEATYNEAKTKLEKGALAQQQAALTAQVDLARQELAQAKERLQMATFVSAMDGVVLLTGAEEGNEVNEGTLLIKVGNDSQLEVSAEINEIDAAMVKVGQPVELSCPSFPGQQFKGKITRVGAAAVEQQQKNSGGQSIGVPVTIKIPDHPSEFKIGYTVDLTIKSITDRDVLTVPIEAVVTRDDKKIVYIVEKGLAHEREVKTRIGNEFNDIVLSGLKAKDTVILNPPPELIDGQKVVKQGAES
jgi:HlyD family secretion protein